MEIKIGKYTITGKHGDYKVEKKITIEATDKKPAHESTVGCGYFGSLEQCVFWGVCNKELSSDELQTVKDVFVRVRELRKLCKNLFKDIKVPNDKK